MPSRSPVDAIIDLIINPILNIFMLILIIGIILSWLINFRIVNPYNPIVGSLWRMTTTLTEPVLRPIRNILPNLGGLDFSPLIVILLIGFLQQYVLWELKLAF